MSDGGDPAAELLAWMASAAGADSRDMACSWLSDHLTLPIAESVLRVLPWPLEELFPHATTVGLVIEGARMRVPGPIDRREDLRVQWNGRRWRWTIRTLCDGVGPRGRHDLTWRALCDAERMLMQIEDAPPSLVHLDGLAASPSTHVRGYAWLAWLALHELGVSIDRDLLAIARREPPELRVMAIWVLTKMDRASPVRELFDGTLEPPASERAQRDALSLLAELPPEPLRDLAPFVARHSRERGMPHDAWARLDPSVWPELLAMADETEPLVRTPVIERRYARYRRPIPDRVQTERASTARGALEEAAPWLPDDAVQAIVERGSDTLWDPLLVRLGPRARGAVGLVLARGSPVTPLDRGREVSLLVALGDPLGFERIEEHLRSEPQLSLQVVPLGSAAIPLLRRSLAASVDRRARAVVLRAIERVARPDLVHDVWPHVDAKDEDTVCSAIAALLAMSAVETPLERARVLERFLHFQPTEWSFAPSFFHVAAALSGVVVPWLEHAVGMGDEVSAVRIVRAAGYLRAWGQEPLPGLAAVAARGGRALAVELERARDRIENPPPMFRPNS